MRSHVHIYLPCTQQEVIAELILTASVLNQIFENGLLSKERVFDVESSALVSMKRGLLFFSDECKEGKYRLCVSGVANRLLLVYAPLNCIYNPPQHPLHICIYMHIGGNPKDDQRTTFLAWDLLRLTIEGFVDLCEDFLIRNPGYFIKSIRINGSVIESLFGRFKYNCGGNLSSVNYRNCVAKLVFILMSSSLSISVTAEVFPFFPKYPLKGSLPVFIM